MCICVYLSVSVWCSPLSAATSMASEDCQEGSLLCPGGPTPAPPGHHRQSVLSRDSLGPSSYLPPAAAPHLRLRESWVLTRDSEGSGWVRSANALTGHRKCRPWHLADGDLGEERSEDTHVEPRSLMVKFSPSPFPLTSHRSAPCPPAPTPGGEEPEPRKPSLLAVPRRPLQFRARKSRGSWGLSPPARSLDGALLRGPPVSELCLLPALRSSSPALLTCPPRICRLCRRSTAPSKTGGASVSQKGSRGASAVRWWGPLSTLEPPTSPGPCGLPTGCRRTGRSCLLLPPVPPPSPLSSFLPPSAPPRLSRSSSLPPPPRLPTAIPSPGP